MLLKQYRIELTNNDHLRAINAPDWHINITAKTADQAWGKFAAQHLAPVFEPVANEYIALRRDYEVRFIRAVIV